MATISPLLSGAMLTLLACGGGAESGDAGFAGPMCSDTDVDDAHPDGINLGRYGECRHRTSPTTRLGLSDYCTYTEGREGKLQESSCVHDECVRPDPGINCPAGSVCRAGACVHGSANDPICVETDPGGDPYTAGSVTSLSQIGASDQCYLSRKSNVADGVGTNQCQTGETLPGHPELTDCGVFEYKCDSDDTSSYEFLLCEHGCKDGACLRLTN